MKKIFSTAVMIGMIATALLTVNCAKDKKNNTNVLGALFLLISAELQKVGVPACGQLSLGDSLNADPSSKGTTYSNISSVFFKDFFGGTTIFRTVGCKPVSSSSSTVGGQTTTVDTYTYSDANAPSFPSKLVSVATTTGVATPVTTTSTMTYNANRFAATKTVSCANTATTGTVNTTWTYDEMNRLTKTVISTPADCAAPGAAATTRTIASTFDGTTYDLLTTSNGLDDNNKTVTTFSGYTRDGAKTLTVTASAVTTTAGVAGNPVVTTTTNTFTDGKLTTQVSAITGGTTTTTKYTYNAAGKLSSSAAALSTGASSAASYTYDSANRLTGATSSSTNAAGVTTTNNSISATYTASGALDTMVSTPNAGTAVITTTFAN